MSAVLPRRTARITFVAGIVTVFLVLAGPASAFAWCWLQVSIVGGPSMGSTITTDTVRFDLVVNRAPGDVRSLVCTLNGPVTASGCDPLVRDGWRQRSFSGMTASGLADGRYLFTVKVVNRWGWVTDIDRRWFVVDVPDDAARCVVSDPAGQTFRSDDGAALTDALSAAAPGARLNVHGTCTGTYSLGSDVTLAGDGPDATLDAAGTGTVLTVNPGVTAEVRDLTITGGTRSGIITQGTLTLSGTTAVTGNSRVVSDPSEPFTFGGGILSDEGTLSLLDDVSITGNTISATGSPDALAIGGGVFSSGDVTIAGNVQISGNTASTPDGGTAAGGGLYNDSAVVTIDGATIDDNVVSSSGSLFADARGGGIYTVGDMVLVDTTVSGNRIQATGGDAFAAGGGIYQGVGNLDLDGSTSVDANTAIASGSPAQAFGGGVYSDTRDALRLLGAATLTNNTASGATASGGGLFTRGRPAVVVAWTGAVTGNLPDNCEPTQTLNGVSCA